MTYTAHLDTFARENLPPLSLWPEMIFETPELQFPERLNIAEYLLDRHVEAGQGDRPCLLGSGGPRTYAEALAQANQIAHVLTEDMGLVPGNRVLLSSPNSVKMALCWLAVAKAGLIAVSAMPLLRAKELTDIIRKAQVGAALCDKRLAEELLLAQTQCPTLTQIVYFNDDAPDALEARMNRHPTTFQNVATAADDTVMIAFTSGTTGQPKGTLHFHRDLLASSLTFNQHVARMTPDDVNIGTPPLAFTYGLGGLLIFPLFSGASTVLLDKVTPDSLLAAIDQYRVTVVWSSPVFYRLMSGLAANYKLTSLRECVSAGEALPTSTRSMWEGATGNQILDGIGSTEMFHIFIAAAGTDIRPGSTGQVVPGYRACILDENDQPLPAGQVGRLAVKGPTGCRYLADDRQRNYVASGWNVTGDSYRLDEDGYFWYQARTDDMIITAGYNVAGPEVEDALMRHAAVAECAVVGAPEVERGTIVKAFVVLKPGFGADAAMVKELQDFVKQTIAPYKYPRSIEFCEVLPRTQTGKLQRFKLRQDATPSLDAPQAKS